MPSLDPPACPPLLAASRVSLAERRPTFPLFPQGLSWQRIREQLARVQPVSLVVLACAVGLITGGGAIAFTELINFVQWLALGSSVPPLFVLPQLPWYRVLLTPAVGGFIVALLTVCLPRDAKGHGVPEVMEAVALGSGKIRPHVGLVKSLVSATTIGTGGSVGREGPIVHIGASLGSSLGQLLRVSPNRLPVLAGCGVAGGIAAVFNAPIAGAFFALEVIMGNFAMPAFGPVMLSSVAATVVSRSYFGDHPAFVVPGYTLLSAWELPLYLVLGAACGVSGLVFIAVLEALEEWFAKLPLPSLAKPALGGLVLGGVIFYVPDVYGVGYATMDAILRGGLSWPWLLLLLPVKMGATSLTLASGGSGGLFLPALYLGAITGGLFGFGMGTLFPTFTGPSGAYALVGMAAFLAGVVHCPITALLLLFEITGDYHIILPLMVSCTISTLVAKVLREESIYTIQLTRRGIDIRRREANLMQAFTVGQVMRQDVPMLPETAPFSAVVQYFLAGDLPVCFVVDTNRHLRGYISLHYVKALLQEDTLDSLVIAKDLAQDPGVTTHPDETLARCLEKFARVDQEYLPVISPTTKELQGFISQRDVLELYHRELIRHEYIGLSLRAETLSTAVLEQVRLPHTYTVAIVQVPPRYAGQTLRALQLRTRHNLTVVAIRRGGFHNQDELPDPDQPLSTPDYLVLVGRPEDVRRFTSEDDTHPLPPAPSV